ncbi:unnamed protein product [Discula destructiva]
MAHPSQQVPPRAFPPAQHPGQVINGQPVNSHSPGPQQSPSFALPGHPPQGVTPRPQGPSGPPGPPGRAASFSAPHPHSQPGSPYSVASPGYGPASPNVTTPTTAPSPSYQTLAPAQQSHFPPPPPPQIVNRNPPPNPNAPQTYSRPNHVPQSAAPAASPIMSTPLTPNPAPSTPGPQPQAQYSSAAFAPVANGPSTPGAMGPPTGRPQREYEYDVTDSLMGTGVNIRDEENNLAEYYAGSYGQDARAGLPANEPGSRASFYGAGSANQPGEDPGNVTQKEFEAREAERAWNESAHRWAATRSLEHKDPFLNYGNLHARMDKIAKGYGLELNLDNKNNPQQAHVQKSRPLIDYPAPRVIITTRVGPDGASVQVNGSVVSPESFLADQLNLLSLGAKHRVRELVTECDKLASHRQESSHGVVPMCWSDDGIPLEEVGLYDPSEVGENGGGETGGSVNGAGDGPRGRKRPLNALSQYLRDVARSERAAEEERLQKRQKRLADEAAAQTGSRAGSNAPGTPGASAPDPDKAPTKKEQKKMAAQKHDASAETVNSTTAKFLGGGKKKYSWMTPSTSTPRTPARASGGPAGTPASAAAPQAPENVRLTAEPRTVIGQWRETNERGTNIQIRDWITALERDGKADQVTMYKAYNMQEPRS